MGGHHRWSDGTMTAYWPDYKTSTPVIPLFLKKNKTKGEVNAGEAKCSSLATPPASPLEDGPVFDDEIKKALDFELPSSPTKKVSFAGQDNKA